jgi:hypothetical protein
MVEEDYIFRTIKEMGRTLLKFLFGLDTDSPEPEQMQNEEYRAELLELEHIADQGKINSAENRLYDVLNPNDRGTLEIALFFYLYLNNFSDDFLNAHDFGRDEIKCGMQDTVAMFGQSSIADAFTI